VVIHISAVKTTSIERKVKTVIVAMGAISFIEFEYSTDLKEEGFVDPEKRCSEEMCIHFKYDTADKEFNNEDTDLTFSICKCDDLKTPVYQCYDIHLFEKQYLQAMADYLKANKPINELCDNKKINQIL
jgi:hypothetical protein